MRDYEKISCEIYIMGEIGSKFVFFMNFEGRSGIVVNYSMIILKWFVDEFLKRVLLNYREYRRIIC